MKRNYDCCQNVFGVVFDDEMKIEKLSEIQFNESQKQTCVSNHLSGGGGGGGSR